MATVYLAEDVRHERRVAIKVLKPELARAIGSERFLREIKITAALSHPHILPLLDSGEVDGFLFYVMPFVTGESLGDRLQREKQLPLDDALTIAREVSDALSYAHAQGIVHRDIKPDNILLQSGHAVVADFGIGRAVDAAGGDSLTETGMSIGTPAYMSPEQAGGGAEVDARSDLYSLACVLYEMLAGQPPFTAPTIESMLHQHLAVDAPPITNLRPAVPAWVSAALQRALAKNPADRFATLQQFTEALTVRGTAHETNGPAAPARRTVLRRLWGTRWAPAAITAVVLLLGGGVLWRMSAGPEASASDLRSIAVLPFATRAASSDEEASIFSEGMHDDLLTKLSKIDSLTVISRTSVMQYAGTMKTIRTIADELGVATVLEGAVQRAGDRVRVNVQLIDALTDEHLWAESYDEELTAANIFAIQTDLAEQIAGAMRATLAPEVAERIEVRPTESLEAYDLYVRGNHLLSKETSRANLEGAAEMFRGAVEADSSYAPAWAGMSRAYHRLMLWKYLPEEEALAQAGAAAERALELDETLAGAHVARGDMLRTERRYGEAERAFRRALELAPGDADAHGSYGELLRDLARPAEAVSVTRRAVQLDPLSVRLGLLLTQSLYFARDWDATLAEAGKLLELEPTTAEAFYWRGFAHAQKGDWAAGIAASQRAIALSPDDRYYPAALAFIYAQAGDRAKALEILEGPERERLPHVEVALVYGELGDLDRAFEYLDRAYRETPVALFYLSSDPSADPLRPDPRWAKLIQKLKVE